MTELINTHIDLPSLSSEFARLTESQIALMADPCFGRLPSRPRLPFRAESVVLMTPRNTRAIGLQPCESMVCKFPITQSESVDPGGRTRSLLQMLSLDHLQRICGTNGLLRSWERPSGSR
jgi:hypothetical protein